MEALLAIVVTVLGLLVVIALGSRLLVLAFPHRRAQEQRVRDVAEALGGRFGRSLFVADPELRISVHGQPVFVTSSFGKHGHEISRIRVDRLRDAPSPGLYLDLEPDRAVEGERLGEDGRAAAAELVELVGHACTVEIRQKLWGEDGFAELLCGGFLTDRDDGPEALARAILLMQRVAYDLVPCED